MWGVEWCVVVSFENSIFKKFTQKLKFVDQKSFGDH